MLSVGTAALVVVSAFTVIGAAPASSAPDQELGHGKFAATVRYTEYGIPHVLAKDYAGLGFGTGYAAAKDNVCEIANGTVTLSGERSKYFGPDASPSTYAGGGTRFSYAQTATNLASDLYFHGMNAGGAVEDLISQPAPLGPTREARDMVKGFAAGFNEYLETETIIDPACAGAPWLRPMTELDLYRRMNAVAMATGQGGLADAIVTAQPPATAEAAAAVEQAPEEAAAAAANLPTTAGDGPASNGLALGADATANGRGMVLANPHLPWRGDLRFWQAQQTIPGTLNVSGATILGMPFVAIGHTSSAAWTMTASTATTFTLFQLQLSPDSPTTYVVDGQPEQMQPHDLTVTVRNPDGSLSEVTRTQWWTRYGPVIGPEFGGLDLPWNADTAFVVADANAGNLRFGNTTIGWAKAKTAGDILTALQKTQGMPWTNTMAADSNGNALLSNIQVAPHVTDDFAAACNTPLGQAIFPAERIAVLDGSRSECAWGSDPDSVQPGTFGAGAMPLLERRDFVENSNDSYWLANPDQPLTGFPLILGRENDQQGPRTRGALTSIAEQLADGPFTTADAQQLAVGSTSYAGALAAADTAALCASLPDGIAEGTNGPVDVSAACDVIANWDRTMTPASTGALLFDRYWRKVPGGNAIWNVPFSAADPVNTPNTLNTALPQISTALADAVAELTAAGFALDAPLAENQYVVRNGVRIPIPGGLGKLGVFNTIQAIWDPAAGYTEVQHGSTYLHVVGFGNGKCPETSTLLTYSQSADSTSPHYADQTELFSTGEWVSERFCESEILSSPELEVIKLKG